MLCYLYKKSGFVSDIYGGYYSWTAAMNAQNSSDLNPSGVQGACPAGWHIPSDSEWKQLETWLGMSQVELNSTSFRGTDQGAKLKDVCSGRFGFNMGVTNASGFSALPGGERDNQGFSGVGYYANFWTSTQGNGGIIRQLNLENNAVTRDGMQLSWGLSIRCVKD